MLQSLSSLIPTAEEMLSLDEESLAMVLLIHLNSYKNQPGNSVFQHGMYSQSNFLAIQTSSAFGFKPEFGGQQGRVNDALMEAWSWLEQNNLLRRDPEQPVPWFRLTRKAESLLVKFEQWEKLGVEHVRGDLQSGGTRVVGGTQDTLQLAWLWTGLKDLEEGSRRKRQSGYVNDLLLISDTRLDELRALKSSEFDFKKLICLCEEININYQQGCYLGTPMLMRSLLDHVPPIFQKTSFTEVANQYGSRSFKGTMQHLDTGAKNIADGHLHSQIRKKETLPEPQQVNFGAALDVLLAEIVRMTEEKHGN